MQEGKIAECASVSFLEELLKFLQLSCGEWWRGRKTVFDYLDAHAYLLFTFLFNLILIL